MFASWFLYIYCRYNGYGEFNGYDKEGSDRDEDSDDVDDDDSDDDNIYASDSHGAKKE